MADDEDCFKAQGSVDSEDSLPIIDPEFDIDSFIDDEFSNISAAMFDSQEDLANGAQQSGGVSLAQQLEGLKESFSDSRGSFKAAKQSVRFQETDDGAADLSVSIPRPADQESVYCEKCRKLIQEDAPVMEVDLVEENGDSELNTVSDPRSSVVSDDNIVDIAEQVGTCWRSLGPVLGVSNSKLTNIDADIPKSEEKAQTLLMTWKQQQGYAATVGSLEQSLLRIKRCDIADSLSDLAGLVTPAVPEIQPLNQPLNMNIKVSLAVDNSQTDISNSVLLCEDSSGRKFLVKEITDGTEWNVEKIVDDERVLERMITAARYSKKTKEQRRQESLRRVSAELSQLRKRIKKVNLSSDDSESDLSPRDEPEVLLSSPKEEKISHSQLSELLRMCEFQSEGWQAMYRVLIKLIGEVGPLDGNSRCLKQLSDFTNELRDQENKLSPKIEQLESLRSKLDKDQVVRLDSLRKWKQTQNQQVDGIEKLLTSLLEQGNIRLTRKQKAMNRRSEPILSRMLTPGKPGRRRANTSETKGSMNDVRDGMSKDQISSPMCARQMQVMER